MELKDGIRRYRKKMNLSMAGLGHLVGAEKSTVCRWEKGDIKPTVDGLIRLAKLFGVTETELLHPKAENEENEDGKNVR